MTRSNTLRIFVRKSKRAYRSWTINAGLLIAVLGAFEQHTKLVPEEHRGYVIMLIGVVMAALRYKTSQPLETR